MKKTILVYGLIAGIILAAFICISMPAMKDMSSGSALTSMFVGYTVQLLAFSLIFFAIRSYREKYNSGVISFSKAFSIGLWISLIGSAFYVIAWALVFHYVMPDFFDKWSALQLEAAAKSGAGPDQIAKLKLQMEESKRIYETWWGFTGMTLFEILPTGILVTLISAGILKRRQPKKPRIA